MAFNMQDVLLEPYGGEILGLSVSATTLLTATWACGALVGFALAALAGGGPTPTGWRPAPFWRGCRLSPP
jgi:BCD family chlorophyll transporter-like MFS transporter